jgi:hypothetical protein
MSGFPGQAPVSTAPLVTFKAGKLQLKETSGGKFMVTPETRKGQVTMFKPELQLFDRTISAETIFCNSRSCSGSARTLG